MTGGALAAAAALPACKTVFPFGYKAKHNLLSHSAKNSPIDTVVIVMSENRSFDHWLGWLGADVRFTRQFVQRFTTFDDYHASLLGPTSPNRDYLHCAQSGGRINNAFPTGPDGFTEPLIWEKLATANVPAGYYYSDLPFLAL